MKIICFFYLSPFGISTKVQKVMCFSTPPGICPRSRETFYMFIERFLYVCFRMDFRGSASDRWRAAAKCDCSALCSPRERWMSPATPRSKKTKMGPLVSYGTRRSCRTRRNTSLTGRTYECFYLFCTLSSSAPVSSVSFHFTIYHIWNYLK